MTIGTAAVVITVLFFLVTSPGFRICLLAGAAIVGIFLIFYVTQENEDNYATVAEKRCGIDAQAKALYGRWSRLPPECVMINGSISAAPGVF